MALGLQERAGGQKRPHLLGRERLAVHRAKPAQPHQLGDAAGVLTIRLDRHGLEGRADMARLKQFHRQPGRLHLGKEPLRQRPGSQASLASFTILPWASTMHTLALSNDTSIPAYCSMVVPR